MRFVRVLAVVAGAFLLAAPAHAVVIDILSEGTATDALEFNNIGDNVLITPVGAWATAPPAVWVSYGDTGAGGTSPANGTIVTFTQMLFLPLGINVGSVTVWADDTAEVWVDGTKVFDYAATQDGACADGPIACEPDEGGVIDLTGLAAGSHTLEFKVKQVGGDGFGVLYSGSIESVPEPGTLMLLGAGIVALRARRKRA